jgi:hypothetical protein
VAWPTLHFSTLSHGRQDFRKKLLNTKCVFWFSLQRLSETFLILRRIRRHITANLPSSSGKVPVILVIFFLKKWNFLDRFSKKKNQTSKPTKIDPVGAELLHAEGQTDRHVEANSRISNFAKAHNNEISLWVIYVFHIVFSIQSEKLYKKAKEDARIWNRSIRKRPFLFINWKLKIPETCVALCSNFCGANL